MKTGIKKVGESALKTFVVLSVIYSVLSLAAFGMSRVPPYDEGQCLSVKTNPFASLKVTKNNILAGTSEVEINFMGQKQKDTAPFVTLRNPNLQAADCP